MTKVLVCRNAVPVVFSLFLLSALHGCGADESTSASDTARDDTSDTQDTTADTVDCDSWLVTYDLTGSEFEIRNTPLGAGDAVNEIGPGTLALRFPDADGQPVDGAVTLVSYYTIMNFNVSEVLTDMTVEAVAGECGVASGEMTAETLAWATDVTDFHSYGTVTCNAGDLICQLAGFEPGVANVRDETHDQPFNSFIFDDAGSFEMDFVQVPNDDAGDTYLHLVGTETSRTCMVAPICP